MLVAIAVPNFGPVLSLLGGTFFTLLSVVFPILFFNKLHEGKLSLWTYVLLFAIILITVASAAGNCVVELKNISKVISGSYE